MDPGTAMALGGSVLSTIDGLSAARKRDKAARDGIREQSGLQGRALGEISEAVNRLGSSSPEQYRPQLASDYVSSLRAATPQAFSAAPRIPGASSRYNEGVSQSRMQGTAFAQRLAQLFAGIDATRRQRMNEGFSLARAGSRVDMIRDEAGGKASANQARVNSIQGSPFIQLLAQGLKQGGSYMAGNSGGSGQSPGWYQGRTPADIAAGRPGIYSVTP